MLLEFRGMCRSRLPGGSPRVKVVRHVGGLLSAGGRHDHDTSYRVSRARRMVGTIARSWARGQKDRRAVLLLLAYLCDCGS